MLDGPRRTTPADLPGHAQTPDLGRILVPMVQVRILAAEQWRPPVPTPTGDQPPDAVGPPGIRSSAGSSRRRVLREEPDAVARQPGRRGQRV